MSVAWCALKVSSSLARALQTGQGEPTWLRRGEIRCLLTEEGLGTAVPWLPKAC